MRPLVTGPVSGHMIARNQVVVKTPSNISVAGDMRSITDATELGSSVPCLPARLLSGILGASTVPEKSSDSESIEFSSTRPFHNAGGRIMTGSQIIAPCAASFSRKTSVFSLDNG